MSSGAKVDRQALLRQLLGDLQEAESLKNKISEFKPDKPTQTENKDRIASSLSRRRRDSGQFLPAIGIGSNKLSQQKAKVMDRLEQLTEVVAKMQKETHKLRSNTAVEAEHHSSVHSIESSRIGSKVLFE